MDRKWVKLPSVVIDNERSIGHWFERDLRMSDKLVKPRC